jgi:Ca2+-binding RTX toxin-like protein
MHGSAGGPTSRHLAIAAAAVLTLAGAIGAARPAGALTCTITGTPGDDILTGTSGVDTICGLEGNDVLQGMNGNDILDGGPGADVVTGGNGFDTATYEARTARLFALVEGVANEGELGEH